MTRAKFRVDSKLETVEGYQVVLKAVVKFPPEKDLLDYTRSGSNIELFLQKESGDIFEVGEEYYVDFTPVVVE